MDTKHTPGPWEAGGSEVVKVLKGLTKRERYHVERGYIGGDITPHMVRRLQHKALFYLHIDSPNGRCGMLKPTPLGVNVRETIKATQP